jgi:solute carrier family 25 (adenine nucleotide translocator) protein 4/5/6/31
MMMTSGEEVKYKSSAHAFAQIIKQEGVKSLFSGAGMNMPFLLFFIIFCFLFFYFSLLFFFLFLLVFIYGILGANILRAIAGASVLVGYDTLQHVAFGKAYSAGSG